MLVIAEESYFTILCLPTSVPILSAAMLLNQTDCENQAEYLKPSFLMLTRPFPQPNTSKHVGKC